MPYSPAKATVIPSSYSVNYSTTPRVRPVKADYVPPSEIREQDSCLLSPRRSPIRRRSVTEVARTYTPPPTSTYFPKEPVSFVSHYAREAGPLPAASSLAPLSLPTSAPTTPRVGGTVLEPMQDRDRERERERDIRDFTRDYSTDFNTRYEADRAEAGERSSSARAYDRPEKAGDRPAERAFERPLDRQMDRSERHFDSRPAMAERERRYVDSCNMDDDKDRRIKEIEKELFTEQRKRSELEAKLLELQSSSTIRVLEGKVAGLQSMLEEKSLEHERTMSHGANTQMRVNELLNNYNHANSIVEDLENQLGHHVVRIQELERNLEKSMQQKENLESLLESHQRSANIEKREHEDALAEKERTEHALRSDLRVKTRQAEEAEMEKLSCRDEITSLHKELERTKMRLNDIISERGNIERRAVEAEEHAERLGSQNAQLKVVSEGLKSELDRESDKTRSVINDLRASEAQRVELEERMRHAEQEVSRLMALEDKCNYLEGGLERAEEDIRNELKMHNETRQRLKEAEERLGDVSRLQHQLLQAEAEVAAKTEAIERMHETIEGHSATVNKLKGDVEKERKTIDTLHHELESCAEYKRNAESKILSLEREAQRASELDGKLRTYEDLLDERGNELRQAHAETARAGMATKELKHRLAEIEELDRRLEHLMHEKKGLEDELTRQQTIQGHVEGENQALIRQLETNQFALEAEHGQVLELDAMLREAKQQLALQSAIELQCHQLEAELNARNTELGKERVMAESEAMRAKHLEAELDAVHERQMVFDANFSKQVAAVEKLQIENGKQSVLVQEKDKDISRLTKELETKESEVQSLRESNGKLKVQLEEQDTRISNLEERETRRTELVEQQMADNTKLKETNSDLSSRLSEEVEKRTRLESQIVQKESEAVKANTLLGKVKALEELNSRKTQDLDALAAQVTSLRSQISAYESDAKHTSQLEARIKESKDQLRRQLEDIERLENEEGRKATALAEARKELERESERLRNKECQLEEERARSAAIAERVQRLEAAAAARSSLEGKIAGLEILAESKEAELRSILEDNSHLRHKLKELESELGGRARVEDVMHEAQTQLMMKNDTISRLEKEEEKRRLIVDEQHKELVLAGEKIRKLEIDLQAMSTKKLEAEARVQELLREGGMKVRADEGELRERMMANERLQAECRELRDRTVNAERQARMREQRAEDLEDDVKRLRHMLQQTDEEKGGLAGEINELRRQVLQERNAAAQSTSKLAELESDFKLQKEKEERLAKSMGEDVRELKMKYEQKVRTLEQRVAEEKSKAEAGEREAARLREELTYLGTARAKSLHAADDNMSIAGRSDLGAVLIREKADSLASEWERTKESVSRLREQLKHG
eukprot:TRINITY_DN7781_c0_g1_i3.p1 TRINITY_DN7781_c0_g1~~TRINITY_DN7781_c0_g1_i3.p1  ORF type:complete len:1371 (+),score=499.88 TRINITY_DN7781_c0_g1_i3:1780-5892(+)